jgi:hypothetical protein
MLKLDNTLLDELGLGSLSEDQKRAMLQHIYETLELRVGTDLANQMTDQQLEDFEKFIDNGGDANQAQALQWLEANLPHYKDVVNRVFEELKTEIKNMAPQILASSAAQSTQVADSGVYTAQGGVQQQFAGPLPQNPPVGQYQQPQFAQPYQQHPQAGYPQPMPQGVIPPNAGPQPVPGVPGQPPMPLQPQQFQVPTPGQPGQPPLPDPSLQQQPGPGQPYTPQPYAPPQPPAGPGNQGQSNANPSSQQQPQYPPFDSGQAAA